MRKDYESDNLTSSGALCLSVPTEALTTLHSYSQLGECQLSVTCRYDKKRHNVELWVASQLDQEELIDGQSHRFRKCMSTICRLYSCHHNCSFVSLVKFAITCKAAMTKNKSANETFRHNFNPTLPVIYKKVVKKKQRAA